MGASWNQRNASPPEPLLKATCAGNLPRDHQRSFRLCLATAHWCQQTRVRGCVRQEAASRRPRGHRGGHRNDWSVRPPSIGWENRCRLTDTSGRPSVRSTDASATSIATRTRVSPWSCTCSCSPRAALGSGTSHTHCCETNTSVTQASVDTVENPTPRRSACREAPVYLTQRGRGE